MTAKRRDPDDSRIEMTVDGVTVHVDKALTDDLEMLELLVRIDEGDNGATPAALRRMFGDEYEQVKDALRDERGVVSTKKAGRLFFAVLGRLSKNS